MPCICYVSTLGSKNGPPGTLFYSHDGFTEKIREALEALGLQSDHYAGHSFSIGAATTAVVLGLEDSLIKALGRWESTTYLM